MEELLRLLNDEVVYNELLDKFTIGGYSFDIDMEGMRHLAREYEPFRKGFVSLQFEGDVVSKYKNEILTDIDASILVDVILNETFIFDPTTEHKDAVVKNYLDSLIYWNKIPVLVPLLVVQGEKILLNNSSVYKVPFVPIKVEVEKSTANLKYLAFNSIKEYVELGEDDVAMYTFNMTGNLIYSPLLITLVVIKVDKQYAEKLVDSDNDYYKLSTIEEYVNELTTQYTNHISTENNPLATSLGIIIKYFLKNE